MMKYEIRICGDTAVMVFFNEASEALSSENARWLYYTLCGSKLADIADFTLTLNSVGVIYDSNMCTAAKMTRKLKGILSNGDKLKASAPRAGKGVRQISVCYLGEFAPDIEKAASALSVSVEQLIEKHTSENLTVMAIDPKLGAYLSKDMILADSPEEGAFALENSVILGKERTFIAPRDGVYNGYVIGKAVIDEDGEGELKPGDRIRFTAVTENKMKKLDGRSVRTKYGQTVEEREEPSEICRITVRDFEIKPVLCTACRRGEAIPASGLPRALDELSAREANMLVGNIDADGVVEIEDGAVFVFESDCVAAFTGADFTVERDGVRVDRSKAVEIDAGDVVTVKKTDRGSRLYMAINGESASVTETGDRELLLEIADCGELLDKMQKRVLAPFSPEKTVELRVIPGPFADQYDLHALDVLYSGEYTVRCATAESVGFDGSRIFPPGDLEYRAFAPAGLLGFDEKGLPVIERTGGDLTSVKKGCAVVIEADMTALAQLTPGTQVRFVPCTLQNAQKAASVQRRAFIKNYLKMNL